MNSDLEAQRALDKLNQSGFEALTEPEKTVVTVWLFESKVANGGFQHYYTSAAGDQAYYAPAALRNIGATQLEEIASNANAVFGPEGPPLERAARKLAIGRAGDAAGAEWEALEARFFECEEDIDELLETYLDRSPELAR
jgi:hypothetical protein